MPLECVTEVSIALLLNFIDISFLPRAGARNSEECEKTQ
jgi:hypothetical protein